MKERNRIKPEDLIKDKLYEDQGEVLRFVGQKDESLLFLHVAGESIYLHSTGKLSSFITFDVGPLYLNDYVPDN